MISSLKRTIKFILFTAVVVVFLVFSIDNRQAVTISLFPLPYSAELSEFLFAIICFVFGALTGGMVAGLGVSRIKRQHKAAKKRVTILENEAKARQEEKLPVPPINRKI